MSLIALLENTQKVAESHRAQLAAQAAQDVAEFEEYGEDIARAFDEEELAATEEALRLGMKLDEDEEEAASRRQADDLELAKELLEKEEALDATCSKDELIAQQLDAQLKREAVRVAKLEKRERELMRRKLCKDDWQVAEQLALDIEREQAALERDERRDRQLARQLVKQEAMLLRELPQTEEKLRSLAHEVNGAEPTPLRSRLRAKLGSLRKSLVEITNDAARSLNAL
jgi:hypothetical protein